MADESKTVELLRESLDLFVVHAPLRDKLKAALASAEADQKRIEDQKVTLAKWLKFGLELRDQWARYQRRDLSQEEFEGFLAEWCAEHRPLPTVPR